MLTAGELEPKVIGLTGQRMEVELNQEPGTELLNRLGGTDRVARVIKKTNKVWPVQDLAEIISTGTSAPKFVVGISQYGDVFENIKKIAVDIKKILRSKGVKMRFVLPGGKDTRLNAAQVIFNKLHQPPNKELSVIKTAANEYVLAETIFVQDIAAYAKRDTSRPARDARVGMLPPKLAQILINLALPEINPEQSVLDPFCGMGTILQEGWLMGARMFGSDISETMIEASRNNLLWLSTNFPEVNDLLLPELFVQDMRQPFRSVRQKLFDAVVTEGYLGNPISSPLSKRELNEVSESIIGLYQDALKNILPILKNGGYLVFCLPAWRSSRRGYSFTVLSPTLLDFAGKLGYSQEHLLPDALAGLFQANSRGTMIYARPDALVGREIIKLRKV